MSHISRLTLSEESCSVLFTKIHLQKYSKAAHTSLQYPIEPKFTHCNTIYKINTILYFPPNFIFPQKSNVVAKNGENYIFHIFNICNKIKYMREKSLSGLYLRNRKV